MDGHSHVDDGACSCQVPQRVCVSVLWMSLNFKFPSLLLISTLILQSHFLIHWQSARSLMQISRCFPTALWIWSCSYHLSPNHFREQILEQGLQKTSMHYVFAISSFLALLSRDENLFIYLTHCWLSPSPLPILFLLYFSVPNHDTFLVFLLVRSFVSWWCFTYEIFIGIFSKQYATDTELTSQLAIR